MFHQYHLIKSYVSKPCHLIFPFQQMSSLYITRDCLQSETTFAKHDYCTWMLGQCTRCLNISTIFIRYVQEKSPREREWKRLGGLPNDWWIPRNFPLPRFSKITRRKELDRFYQRGSITDNITERKENIINPIKLYVWLTNLFWVFQKFSLMKEYELIFSSVVVCLKLRPETTRIAWDTVAELLTN